MELGRLLLGNYICKLQKNNFLKRKYFFQFIRMTKLWPLWHNSSFFITVEQSECLTSTSNTNLSTYNRKSSFHTTPFHQRNGDRNHYYRNSDKYPSQPHNRTQSHEENVHRNTSYPFKRRPFYQSSSSRYYNNINNRPNPSTNNRTYRSPEDTVENKENTTTKPLFNEGKVNDLCSGCILWWNENISLNIR